MKIVLTENQIKYILSEQLKLYHGSPHDFDKFSSNHTETGRGATAYGWGLYFTSSESIGRHYRDCLTHASEDTIGNMSVADYYNKISNKADRMDDPGIEYEKMAFLEYLDLTRDFQSSLDRVDNDEVIEWAENVIKPIYNPAGFIYCTTFKRDHRPSEFVFMDWEHPPTDEVSRMILKQIKKEKPERVDEMMDVLGLSEGYYGQPATCDSLYSLLTAFYDTQKEASLFLLRCGIDGIRFKPVENINDTEDEFNYVIFDENSIVIDEKKKY